MYPAILWTLNQQTCLQWNLQFINIKYFWHNKNCPCILLPYEQSYKLNTGKRSTDFRNVTSSTPCSRQPQLRLLPARVLESCCLTCSYVASSRVYSSSGGRRAWRIGTCFRLAPGRWQYVERMHLAYGGERRRPSSLCRPRLRLRELGSCVQGQRRQPASPGPYKQTWQTLIQNPKHTADSNS